MSAEEEKHFTDIMNGLGESSSLHGIPKIITSRQIVVKLLWCFLLIGAITLFSVHLHALVEEYTSYPTKTSVTLKYAPLEFPALTFCNMNPMKRSETRGEKFLEIRKILNDANYDVFLDDKGGVDSELAHAKHLSDYRSFNDSRDTFMAWKNRLLTEISKFEEEDRLKAGHQIIDFIRRATYEDRHLPFGMFRTKSTIKFGNCFTLDSDVIVARGSGSTNSIHFVFDVDALQQLHSFSDALGVRMVLHEKGTYPLPDAEGITLGTKYETHIGIRMTKISRLGGIYSGCSDGESFTKKYGIKYTVPVCYGVCENENVFKACNCVPLSSEIDLQPDSNVCNVDNITEWECVRNIKDSVNNGQIPCNCKNRCNKIIYSTTVSGRRWPHISYLENVLLKETCRRMNDTRKIFSVSFEFQYICRDFKYYGLGDYRWEKLADNFLSVYIYFEDLNYEDITEEPLYNTERFLSDIGGALGLYMGASFLTWVELLQVILEIVLHLRRKWRHVFPETKSSDEIKKETEEKEKPVSDIKESEENEETIA